MSNKITTRPGGATGKIDWNSGLTLGEPLGPGRDTFSNGAETVTVSSDGRLEQNNSNRGIRVNFAQNAFLLMINRDTAATLIFNPPVRSAALQLVVFAPHLPEDFAARVQARLVDGSTTPEFSRNGHTTTSRDDTAITLGIQCGALDADILSISYAVSTADELANPLRAYGINFLTYASAAAVRKARARTKGAGK